LLDSKIVQEPHAVLPWHAGLVKPNERFGMRHDSENLPSAKSPRRGTIQLR
jgi:hypothetical protein